MDYIAALKVLRKLIKMGDTERIVATIDGAKLDKTDVDFHAFVYVLEAWRDTPQEYYRCEFSYFHPKHAPEVKLNGKEKFQEMGDVDLRALNITFEITFTDAPGGDTHVLKFEYPFV